MPEVILPCPACGSTDCECLVCTINADESQTIHFHMVCNRCFTSGPIADDAESAKKFWDYMPRALRWTHEPPKVAGKYWWSDKRHPDEASIINVTETKLDGYLRNPIGEYEQFAGPIAPPIE